MNKLEGMYLELYNICMIENKYQRICVYRDWAKANRGEEE